MVQTMSEPEQAVQTKTDTKPLLEKFAARGSSFYLNFDKTIVKDFFGWTRGKLLGVQYDLQKRRIMICEHEEAGRGKEDE